ncbi:unnamed protein product [Bursaphelenchus xylophilus]|uniref:Protein alan shepard n=1 Tax=Bursaphelenchus xylophilus TaxID=6326 RepID=A0A1I7SUD3_BURXY|nr:unnamed protein product [Bursaphelenchus xylophilus]CAG9107267.1 unnamed protein product [Bursaphelenchus xylophilus]
MSRESVSPRGKGQASTPANGGYGDGQGDGFTESQRASRRRRDTDMSKTNIYIRGLTPSCVPEELFNLCQKYGNITSTKAVVDQDTKKCKGYGFVAFEDPESAARAIDGINKEGRYQAQIAKEIRPRPERTFPHAVQDPTNLYIANLPKDFEEVNIRDLFSRHGVVISTRVLRFDDGSSRCVGFARMDSKETCEFIINRYHGKPLEGHTENLVVKLADSGSRRSKPPPPPPNTGMGDQSGIGHWQSTPPYNSYSEEEQSVLSPSYYQGNGVAYSPPGGQFVPFYQVFEPQLGTYPQYPTQLPVNMYASPVYSQGPQSPLNQTPPQRPPVSGSGPIIYSPPQNIDYYPQKEAYKFNQPFYPYPYGQVVPQNAQQDPQQYVQSNFQPQEGASSVPYITSPYMMDNTGQFVYGQSPPQHLHHLQQTHIQQLQAQQQQPQGSNESSLEQEVSNLNINKDSAPEASPNA